MEPLPAAHLAGLTPPEIKLRFFDDRFEEVDFNQKTDLVAISVETYTALRSYQIASEYRKRNIPVIMGGFHPTLLPQEAIEYADSIVIGEAEESWPKLLGDFQKGALQPSYSNSDSRPDISKTIPNRNIYGSRKYLPLSLIEATRGCTFRCEFCSIQQYFNSTQNARDIGVIIEEIKSLKKNLIFFVDDNLVSKPEYAALLFEALIPLKIRWVSQASITLSRDRQLMKLMLASGCQGVLVGFESLETENLKQMNKPFNFARGGIREAVRTIHRSGIRLYGTFIFGYDHDTPQSIQKTLDFCKDEKLFMVAFNHLTPFPGTPLYQRLEQENRLLFDKWWLSPDYRYGMIPFRTNLSPDYLEKSAIAARRSFYSFPSIARRATNWANISNLNMVFPYFFINTLLRADSKVRHGLPLGDRSWQGPLIKARN